MTTDTSDLVKKTDYDTKIGKIEKKILDHHHDNNYITTTEFNKLTAEISAARLKQSNLATKADIDNWKRQILIIN